MGRDGDERRDQLPQEIGLVTRYLTEEDVGRLLSPAEAVAVIEACFERMARGSVENRPRYRLRLEHGALAVMSAADLELGYRIAGDDAGKPFVEVSGRKGLGVKADDLIDKLIQTALAEVESRHEEEAADERRTVALSMKNGRDVYRMASPTRIRRQCGSRQNRWPRRKPDKGSLSSEASCRP